MKYLALLLCSGFAWVYSAAQSISFKLLDAGLADTSLPELRTKFGGISSIEAFPADLLYEKKEGMGNAFIITTDHPKDPKQQPQKSYSFILDPNNTVHSPIDFFGLNSIESVRYNERLHKIFFSYEYDHFSGVGVINSEKGVVTIDTIFTDMNYKENRGIEGITFTSDDHLWIANESGSNRITGAYTAFYSIPFNDKIMRYDTAMMTIYKYPFDKCVCLDSCSKFNGGYGSGVSEILALEKGSNKLLVLERCFDGVTGHVRLFLARVETGSDIMSKELVFDFNDYFIPDNLEGMCWGKDKNGNKILYLVSDNNYRVSQKNQVVKLQMIRN